VPEKAALVLVEIEVTAGSKWDFLADDPGVHYRITPWSGEECRISTLPCRKNDLAWFRHA